MEPSTLEKRRSGFFPWTHVLPHRHRHPTLQKVDDERTLGERVADNIARFGGSWPFIFMFLGLIATWMIINTVLVARIIHGKQFDPYPYIALNLALSALAGLQAPIIMMSQNRAAARDEALANHHYEESRRMEDLIQANQKLLDVNTDLTKKIHELATQIHQLVTSRG